ncbi:MAG: hypothetical protein KKD29_05085 [Candidatus Omnitrophica bacterium]|nr:hypothetical protein [Candidatus Omnitrophota bacterium]
MNKKILLLYISEHSGHHQAAIALEKAILKRSPGSDVLSINAFRYVNPVMERIIHGAYMRVIKKRPEIWGYLYDNPKIIKKTERLKNFINRSNSQKIEKLISRFEPDVVACTQAFPCGIFASYKKRYKKDTPLVGILTDYAPHSYWIYDNVDIYVVPSKGVGEEFIKKGVAEDKIKALGVPIDHSFAESRDKISIRKRMGISPGEHVVLVMGGTHGIGPDDKLVKSLSGSKSKFCVIVITGVNKKLLKKVKRIAGHSEKKIIPLGFVNNVCEIMDISDAIITKPGGLTTAEAMAKTLPMIILNPLPGQEDFNAKFLASEGMAFKATSEKDATCFLESLFDNDSKRSAMRMAMAKSAKPNSSSDIADLLLNLAH